MKKQVIIGSLAAIMVLGVFFMPNNNRSNHIEKEGPLPAVAGSNNVKGDTSNLDGPVVKEAVEVKALHTEPQPQPDKPAVDTSDDIVMVQDQPDPVPTVKSVSKYQDGTDIYCQVTLSDSSTQTFLHEDKKNDPITVVVARCDDSLIGTTR